MKRGLQGYTFIEVMLVLAISTMLFFSAAIIFYGQQRQTQFSQSMEDLSSRIQTYATQINSGSFFDQSGYTCATTGSPPRARLSAGSSPLGSNTNCIVLGQAFQVDTSEDKIYLYTVFGSRVQPNGEQSATLEQANPEPALTGDPNVPNNWVLVNEYNVLGDAQILSSKIEGAGATNYNLVGLYKALSAEAAGFSGSVSTLRMKAYPTTASPKTAQIANCIREDTTCQTIVDASRWNLCLQDGSGERTVEIAITSRTTGISATINDKVCS